MKTRCLLLYSMIQNNTYFFNLIQKQDMDIDMDLHIYKNMIRLQEYNYCRLVSSEFENSIY